MDLKEKLLASFMAFEERVDVHSELHDIRTAAIENFENKEPVIIEGKSEQQNIMHFNVAGIKNTLLFTESTSKGMLKYE